jgi:hypothetical protein
MNNTDFSMSAIPLIETQPGSAAHDLFGSASSADDVEIFRSLWQDFCQTLIQRLEALKDFTDAELLSRELHTLRGMTAQFGLFLLEIYLFSWEKKTSDTVAATPRFLPGSLALASHSFKAMEEAFPFLQSPTG